MFEPEVQIADRRLVRDIPGGANVEDGAAEVAPIGRGQIVIGLQQESRGRRRPGDDHRVERGHGDGQNRRAGILHNGDSINAPESSDEGIISVSHRCACVWLTDGAAQ